MPLTGALRTHRDRAMVAAMVLGGLRRCVLESGDTDHVGPSRPVRISRFSAFA